MNKTLSVVKTRQQFANLISYAERGDIVSITRRGKPVAVMISAARYARLARDVRSFSEVALELRDNLHVEDLGIDENTFSDLRDPSTDRKSH